MPRFSKENEGGSFFTISLKGSVLGFGEVFLEIGAAAQPRGSLLHAACRRSAPGRFLRISIGRVHGFQRFSSRRLNGGRIWYLIGFWETFSGSPLLHGCAAGVRSGDLIGFPMEGSMVFKGFRPGGAVEAKSGTLLGFGDLV